MLRVFVRLVTTALDFPLEMPVRQALPTYAARFLLLLASAASIWILLLLAFLLDRIFF